MPFTAESERPVRVAAAGDVHCREENRAEVLEAFAAVRGEADLVLLAGDLTSHGTLEEAAILCEAVQGLGLPVFAVLGNHDWHAGLGEEMRQQLAAAGVEVVDGRAAIREVAGVPVGVAGAKGFVGGFAPHHLPDFGEPSLRRLYAEGCAEVDAFAAALREISTCPLRLGLLHYAPIEATLAGEPREIFVFLGSDRLAAPILEHGPDLVVHGHAHAGSPAGEIGGTPVHNVSLPVAGGFKLFELTPASAVGPIP